jgi:hypothetical protein
MVRAKFLDYLKEAFQEGTLRFTRTTEHLNDPPAFGRFTRKLKRKKWVLYAKEPFGGAHHVYRYLSRYTHRVAICNQRLLRFSHGKVTFQARDNTTPGHHRVVTLETHEFIRRFLLHVLPKGFVRIRHYGLLAPCNTKTKLQKAKELIMQMHSTGGHNHLMAKENGQSHHNWQELMKEVTGIDLAVCPQCGKGTLLRVRLSFAHYISLLIDTPITILDSS